MKEASSATLTRYKNIGSAAENDLVSVAAAFVQLQQSRHSADYDLTVTFSSLEVAQQLRAVGEAFESWSRIKDDKIAQDYLFSLLFRER